MIPTKIPCLTKEQFKQIEEELYKETPKEKLEFWRSAVKYYNKHGKGDKEIELIYEQFVKRKQKYLDMLKG